MILRIPVVDASGRSYHDCHSIVSRDSTRRRTDATQSEIGREPVFGHVPGAIVCSKLDIRGRGGKAKAEHGKTSVMGGVNEVLRKLKNAAPQPGWRAVS
jgi:hypothetical protein